MTPLRSGSLRAAAGALCGMALLLAACESRSPLRIRPPPVIQSQWLQQPPDALKVVAVLPFYPLGVRSGPVAAADPNPRAPATTESATLIGSFFSEALTTQGLRVIPPSDVEAAFLAAGHPVPRQDPRAATKLASDVFGATAVALGKVLRFREREGSAAGSTRPASVAFEIALYHVPTGRRMWTGRFEETQVSITENILRAREYPGSGTRWLTATEFARWGAGEAAKAVVTRR